MSLETLRAARRARLRPAGVFLLTRECPRPQWRWLLDDPSCVWLPERSDVRAHDLRALTGLPVTALVDDLGAREVEVREAVASVGAVLAGIADGQRAVVTEHHPWAANAEQIAGAGWSDLVGPALVSDRNFHWSL